MLRRLLPAAVLLGVATLGLAVFVALTTYGSDIHVLQGVPCRLSGPNGTCDLAHPK